MSKSNLLSRDNFCKQVFGNFIIQVKLTKISYIATLFKVWFIQDSVLFKVWFIQDSVLFKVWFIQDSVLFKVWFIQDSVLFKVRFI